MVPRLDSVTPSSESIIQEHLTAGQDGTHRSREYLTKPLAGGTRLQPPRLPPPLVVRLDGSHNGDCAQPRGEGIIANYLEKSCVLYTGKIAFLGGSISLLSKTIPW